MWLLCAPLPDCRIATSVKNSQHNNSRGFKPKEHRVWEPTYPNAPNVPMHHRKTLRVLNGQTDSSVDLRNKLAT
jgi:hypothetical protein